jgi:hypothetical protein
MLELFESLCSTWRLLTKMALHSLYLLGRPVLEKIRPRLLLYRKAATEPGTADRELETLGCSLFAGRGTEYEHSATGWVPRQLMSSQ